jgi:hypothetical protein
MKTVAGDGLLYLISCSMAYNYWQPNFHFEINTWLNTVPQTASLL